MNVSFDFKFDVDNFDSSMGRLFVFITTGVTMSDLFDSHREVPVEIVRDATKDICVFLSSFQFTGGEITDQMVNVYSIGSDTFILRLTLVGVTRTTCMIVRGCIYSVLKAMIGTPKDLGLRFPDLI
jgi:hypothetical protein